MQNIGSLFLGIIPKEFREYVTRVLKNERSGYLRLYDINAGAFSIASCAVQAGFEKSQIYCSDVSLYSSVIGYFLSNKNIADLEVRINDGNHEGIVTDVAEILLCIKYYAMGDNNFYAKQLKKEVKFNWAKYKEQIENQLKTLYEHLGGIHYECRDMMDVVDMYKDDSDVIICADPPGNKQGYFKMFDTDGIVEWKEPKFEIFDPKNGKQELIQIAAESEAGFLIRNYKEIPVQKINKVIAIEAGDSFDYYLYNREFGKTIYRRKETAVQPKKVALFSDEDRIRMDSKIWFEPITKEQALYYRDLFAHRLGVTRSELYVAMFIDGKMSSVCGIYLSDWCMKGANYIFESFGFSVRPKLYPRINKLHMMCLTSHEFRDFIKAKYKAVQHELTTFRTVCLARHHEQKGNRGVLRLESREQMKNGMFKLKYVTEFKDETWQDMKTKFLKKEGYNENGEYASTGI